LRKGVKMDGNNFCSDENEIQRFAEFKKKLNTDAAQATISRLELEMYDTSISKEVLKNNCREANAKKLGAVCVLPCNVKPCVSFLGSDPDCALITCISYPYGGDTTAVKVTAVKRAIKDGVDEVEVTAPVSYIRDGNWGYFKRELKKLKKFSKKRQVRINIPYSLFAVQDIPKICTTIADCGITAIRISFPISGEPVNNELITKVCQAVKDKCSVKVDGFTTCENVKLAQTMGVSNFGSKYALDLATQIFNSVKD
jgi:deoxyribose-phosphate aldolase